MTDNNHPITPPDELVNLLRYEAPLGIRDDGVTRELHLITAAYRAGADQQLEACIHWLLLNGWGQAINGLRAACRPKPPSLKEQALAVLEDASNRLDAAHENIIRRALEQAND